MSDIVINQGERVAVEWYGYEKPLMGVFLGYSSVEPNEDFQRLRVKMDNGFACHGAGFHPDYVTNKA